MTTRGAAALALGLGVLAAAPAAAQPARDWRGFYDGVTLGRTLRNTAPDVRALLEQDIPAVLTVDERERLAGVTIAFPSEDRDHLLNVYTLAGKRVVFPASSLRFLRDVTAAYAWLSVHGFGLQTISDYLVTVKYRGLAPFAGGPHTPLPVLGVPETALDEPEVAQRFQRLYGNMLVFLLGHELGHVYHRHGGYAGLSAAEAQAQETACDRFGLSLLERLGEPPVGAPLFFHMVAHLEAFADEPQPRVQTHPLSANRILAMVARVREDAGRFGHGRKHEEVTLGIADDLAKVATVLGDPGAQKALRWAGRYRRPDELRPRPAPVAAAQRAR